MCFIKLGPRVKPGLFLFHYLRDKKMADQACAERWTAGRIRLPRTLGGLVKEDKKHQCFQEPRSLHTIYIEFHFMIKSV